jgi:hypothetical protein
MPRNLIQGVPESPCRLYSMHPSGQNELRLYVCTGCHLRLTAYHSSTRNARTHAPRNKTHVEQRACESVCCGVLQHACYVILRESACSGHVLLPFPLDSGFLPRTVCNTRQPIAAATRDCNAPTSRTAARLLLLSPENLDALDRLCALGGVLALPLGVTPCSFSFASLARRALRQHAPTPHAPELL